MSPEDDLQTISATINNDLKSPSRKINNTHKNESPNKTSLHGYTNGENVESSTWLPLLAKNKIDFTESADNNANNNKWMLPAGQQINDNNKYRWEELPQDDDSTTHMNGRDGINAHDKHEQDANYDDDDTSNCGVGFCKPKWARHFASTHVFMVIFLFAWVLQVIIILFYSYILVFCFLVRLFAHRIEFFFRIEHNEISSRNEISIKIHRIRNNFI